MLSSSGCLFLCQTWQKGSILARLLFSLSFFPFCASLNLGHGPRGPGSIVPEENCQSGQVWLNSESRSFMKELICYSLPLSHTLLVSIGLLCNSPTSFLGLFFSSCLFSMFTHSPTDPPLKRLPWLGKYIMLFLFFFGGEFLCEMTVCYSVDTANSVITSWFT